MLHIKTDSADVIAAYIGFHSAADTRAATVWDHGHAVLAGISKKVADILLI